ncbi:uncharacterized protein METZ01_LOCUS385140 [marine metagenome]|uniref:Maltogenic Amylase C-terminal domain-containing protein n=1 Tax=marine metagenome TaxID=408172 RepID=A0A382UDG0_9ZZZZ
MLWLKEIAEESGTTKYGCVALYELDTIYFGIWIVLCVFNFTPSPVMLPREGRLAELFPDGKARDLAGGSEITVPEKGIILCPYQALWLLSR